MANLAVLLGRLGDKRAVRPLAKLLRDRQWMVRLAAAAALGVLKDDSAVEPLLKTRADKEEEVVVSAYTALRALGWRPDSESESMRMALFTNDSAVLESMGEKAVGFLKETIKTESMGRENAASILAGKAPQALREAWKSKYTHKKLE
jgi:HEAT repeat protein